MRSATLLPMRMNAAETSASKAMADCTPLTVVPRSRTTAEIETFMSDVSTTRTNIAIARSSARRLLVGSASRSAASAISGGQRLLFERLELGVVDDAAVEQLLGAVDLGGGAAGVTGGR